MTPGTAARTEIQLRISWPPLPPSRSMSSQVNAASSSPRPSVIVSSTQRSQSGLMWPVLGTPIQCEMPPVAISATRSEPGRASMKRRTKAPRAHERRGVGSGGATQLVSTGRIGSVPSGIRKCAGTETSSQNSRS